MEPARRRTGIGIYVISWWYDDSPESSSFCYVLEPDGSPCHFSPITGGGLLGVGFGVTIDKAKENIWFGYYYANEITSHFIPDVYIEWINSIKEYGLFANRDLPTRAIALSRWPADKTPTFAAERKDNPLAPRR